jgi:hypothetical protein
MEITFPSYLRREKNYLRKTVFPIGKSDETFQQFMSTFKEKLGNIDSVKNRSEHQMWIYKNYFLPSQRVNLTVAMILPQEI